MCWEAVSGIFGALNTLLGFANFKKNKDQILVELSKSFESCSMPGKYLKSDNFDISFTDVVALSVKVSVSKPVTLNNVKIQSFLVNDYIGPIKKPFYFPAAIRLKNENTGLADSLIFPKLATYKKLPLRFESNDTKEFQLVFDNEKVINADGQIHIIFDFGITTKEAIWKIPALEDRAKPDHTLA